MAKLDQETIECITSVVSAAVAKAIGDHPCRFNVPSDMVDEIGHALGVYKDIGGGSANKGIEIIRDNHKCISVMRNRMDKVTMLLVALFITVVGGGLFAALWLGVKSMAGAK